MQKTLAFLSIFIGWSNAYGMEDEGRRYKNLPENPPYMLVNYNGQEYGVEVEEISDEGLRRYWALRQYIPDHIPACKIDTELCDNYAWRFAREQRKKAELSKRKTQQLERTFLVGMCSVAGIVIVCVGIILYDAWKKGAQKKQAILSHAS